MNDRTFGPMPVCNFFGKAPRIWLMSDCPGCGETQYQRGPRADSVVTDPGKKWDWKCWACHVGWRSVPTGALSPGGE